MDALQEREIQLTRKIHEIAGYNHTKRYIENAIECFFCVNAPEKPASVEYEIVEHKNTYSLLATITITDFETINRYNNSNHEIDGHWMQFEKYCNKINIKLVKEERIYRFKIRYTFSLK